MSKKVILIVSLVLLLGVGISGIIFGEELFKTSISDVMSEKRFTIKNQEDVEVTLSIPMSELSESIYTSEGRSFSENEVVVYQTDTTSIYLEKVFLSHDGYLCFVLNHSYELPDSGVVLVPYSKKKSSSTASYRGILGLVSREVSDDKTTYTEAVSVTGHGPSEIFSFAIPVEICKKLEGTMKIDLFTNQVTYARIK